MDERELIARLQKRDETAFEELIRQYEKKVYTLCFRMCGNSEDAEEAAETDERSMDVERAELAEGEEAATTDDGRKDR